MPYILQYNIQNTDLEQDHNINAKLKNHHHKLVCNYYTQDEDLSLSKKKFHVSWSYSNHMTLFLPT